MNVDNANNAKKVSYTTDYVLAAGYALFFCIACILGMSLYFWVLIESRPVPPVNAFATSLPPTTPTPQIRPEEQGRAPVIFKDDFSSDRNYWTDIENNSKAQVTQGKLRFESRSENSDDFTSCDSCPALDEPFYLQVDFATSQVTDRGFGIYFNYDYTNRNSFFLFRINPEARKYYFFHGDDAGWSLRSSGDCSEIQSFPETNTLGIYAMNDLVEFYVNGKIIGAYQQSDYVFHKGGFGFYIDGSDFQLVIDNLIITQVGK